MKNNKSVLWIGVVTVVTLNIALQVLDYYGEKEYVEIHSLSADSLYTIDEYSA